MSFGMSNGLKSGKDLGQKMNGDACPVLVLERYFGVSFCVSTKRGEREKSGKKEHKK
jgi:hypothetical protein